MSIYYNYAPDGTNIVVLFYVYDCIYWYSYEALGECLADTMGNRYHVNFLRYANWFMSIRISQMKDHSISIYQARYVTSFVAKYLDMPQLKQVQSVIIPIFHLV